MAFCGFHPERIALEKCSFCDIPICEECKMILKGRSYCPTCSVRTIPGVTLVPYRNPYHAALSSLILPGLGQVYNGQLRKALKIFLFSWLILPWIYGIFDAYFTALQINARCLFTKPSAKDFVAFLLVAMIVGFGFFQGFRMLSPDGYSSRQVKEELLVLSQAAERYQREHGKYPENFFQLYFATPRYVEEMYCEAERHGYNYTCQFLDNGYVFMAEPLNKSFISVKPKYTVTTGGILARTDRENK
jgi:hypothetical protein